MKRKKKLLLIVGGIVVVAVIVILNFTMSTSNGISVQADTVKSRNLVENVSASGRIQPQTKVNITSQVNGEIINLSAREGDNVKTGDLLVVLDTVQLRSNLDQALYAVNEVNALLSGSKTALEEAEEEFNRQKRLFENNLTSETMYKNSQYAFQKAKSSREAAQAQAQRAQAEYEKQLDYLSKAKIVAPMPGVITFLDCEVGEIAAAQTAYTQGKTLMTISNLNVFEVEVEVDETEITKVELSQEVDIEVDAFPDTTFKGQVVEIGNTAIVSGYGTQDQSTNFKVKVIFNDPNVKIRPGMSATVDITTAHCDDVLSIPYSAVVMRSLNPDSLERVSTGDTTQPDSKVVSEVQAAENTERDSLASNEDVERKEFKGVFVIKDAKVQFVQIETGIADQKNIEITSGLTDGDSIVSGPYRVLRTIKDGDMVKIEKQQRMEQDEDASD